MGTKLERIAEISANSPKPEFTSLYHLINEEMLLSCYKELDGSKAVGIDEVSKTEYEVKLEENTGACHHYKKIKKMLKEYERVVLQIIVTMPVSLLGM